MPYTGESDRPRVAVLMATFNGAGFLREQIDSILAQQGVEVSVFIRDDHSQDETRELVRNYEQATGKVFLLPSKDQRLNVTKNFFSIVRDVDLSAIDYISYSDQDDVWLPGKLIAAIDAMKQHDTSCYASNLVKGDAAANKRQRTGLLQYVLNYKSNKQTAWDHYLEAASAGCTLVLAKDAAVYFQGRLNTIYDRIPANASHDWSTYALTRIGGFRWYIDPHSYIIYRQHTRNAYGTNAGLQGVSKLLNLFRSGWYRQHILMIDNLYNDTDHHPAFMKELIRYDQRSLRSRWRVSVAISSYRRKRLHRVLLFVLIMCGCFR